MSRPFPDCTAGERGWERKRKRHLWRGNRTACLPCSGSMGIDCSPSPSLCMHFCVHTTTLYYATPSFPHEGKNITLGFSDRSWKGEEAFHCSRRICVYSHFVTVPRRESNGETCFVVLGREPLGKQQSRLSLLLKSFIHAMRLYPYLRDWFKVMVYPIKTVKNFQLFVLHVATATLPVFHEIKCPKFSPSPVSRDLKIKFIIKYYLQLTDVQFSSLWLWSYVPQIITKMNELQFIMHRQANASKCSNSILSVLMKS